jgi:hypothetical protein
MQVRYENFVINYLRDVSIQNIIYIALSIQAAVVDINQLALTVRRRQISFSRGLGRRRRTMGHPSCADVMLGAVAGYVAIVYAVDLNGNFCCWHIIENVAESY